jgi:Leucine-rich repeat (LRR) protein
MTNATTPRRRPQAIRRGVALLPSLLAMVFLTAATTHLRRVCDQHDLLDKLLEMDGLAEILYDDGTWHSNYEDDEKEKMGLPRRAKVAEAMWGFVPKDFLHYPIIIRFSVDSDVPVASPLLPRLGTLARLEELSLSGSLGGRDLSFLRRLTNLKLLTLEGLRGNDLSPLRALTHLEALSIDDFNAVLYLQDIPKFGVLHIQSNSRRDAKRVERLWSDRQREALSKLTNLVHLEVPMTDSDMSALEPLKTVWLLRIAGAIDGSGFAHLRNMRSLKILDVGFFGCRVRDENLKYLRGLDALEDLTLIAAPLSGEGLVYLKDLRRLHSLNLSATKVDDRGLMNLKDLAALKRVYVGRTGVTGRGAGLFHAARPDVDIQYGDDGALHTIEAERHTKEEEKEEEKVPATKFGRIGGEEWGRMGSERT